MPVRTEKRYHIECDGRECGARFDGTDEQDKAEVIHAAEADGWEIAGVRTYCPECADERRGDAND